MWFRALATVIPATSKALISKNPNPPYSTRAETPAISLVFLCRFSTIRLRYTPASEPDFHVPSHAAPH
ncbi:hypothetical protein F01_350087 [Burkholderia cenocepacia]|nr:hypothetical protein F01_350087 [Burkholderia cenocepacia]